MVVDSIRVVVAVDNGRVDLAVVVVVGQVAVESV